MRTAGEADKECATLHVGNLDRRVTEEELYCALKGPVAILNITIPKRENSVPVGHAIVQLKSAKAAKETAAAHSKLELRGRRITMWEQSSPLCRKYISLLAAVGSCTRRNCR